MQVFLHRRLPRAIPLLSMTHGSLAASKLPSLSCRPFHALVSINSIKSTTIPTPLSRPVASPSSLSASGPPEWGGLTKATLAALLEMGVRKPTPTQAAYIPRVLSGESLLLGAATGTGKTIAYLAPLLQRLKELEASGVVTRRKRPRLLILAPTRELALQILGVVKAFSHVLKLRSVAVVGGAKQSSQRDALDSPVDVLVGTPGRLALLHSQGHIHLSDVRAVVIDEADTLLMSASGAGAGAGEGSPDDYGRRGGAGAGFSGFRGRGRDGRDGGLLRLRAGEGAGVGGFMSEVKELLGRLRARSVAAARAASSAAGDEDGASASVALMGEVDADGFGHEADHGNGQIQYILAGATMPVSLAKRLTSLIPELKHSATSSRSSASASALATSASPSAAGAGGGAGARLTSPASAPALPPSSALHVVPARIAQEFRRVGGGAGAKHAALAEVLGELLGDPEDASAAGGAAAGGDLDDDDEDEVGAAAVGADDDAKSGSSASPASTSASRSPAASVSVVGGVKGGRASRERARLAKRGGRVIVFCSSVASARSTAFFAAEQGYSAASLHGEIPPARRAEEFALFASGKVPLLICTDGAARGLDFPSAQAVVMFDFPRTAADYVHRAGRVGRAGRAGRCIALCGPRDAYLSRGIEAAVSAGKPLAPDMPTRDPRADGDDDHDDGDSGTARGDGAAGSYPVRGSSGAASDSRGALAGGSRGRIGLGFGGRGSGGPRPASPPQSRRPSRSSSLGTPEQKSAGAKSTSSRRR